MPPTDAQLEELRNLFERYRGLPRHAGDADFLERLHNLQAWERESIRKRHAAACADNPDYKRVLNFYLDELHNGFPLDELLAKGPEGLENARRMDRAFDLFANAVEFSVLSATQQDRLVEALGDSVLTEANYQAAIRECADAGERQLSLELMAEIGQQVSQHIRSRIIYTGFRLLRGLFHKIGMGEIHATLDAGFRQLRNVPQLAQILGLIVTKEKAVLKSLQIQSGPV